MIARNSLAVARRSKMAKCFRGVRIAPAKAMHGFSSVGWFGRYPRDQFWCNAIPRPDTSRACSRCDRTLARPLRRLSRGRLVKDVVCGSDYNFVVHLAAMLLQLARK